MRLGHIELFVADPLKSMAFYRDVLGFSVTTVQSETYVWLQLGEQEILLRPTEAQTDERQPSVYHRASIGLVMYTANVTAARTQLEAKGINFVPQPDGCLSFTDLDGHWFQLSTRAKVFRYF